MDNKKTIASAVAAFALVEAIFILNPALGLLAAGHPEMPYATITLLSTLPNVISVPTGILAGALIRKQVSFKPLVCGSILLVVIGGIIPYFITSFGSWIMARCLFGVGFGLASPIGATMVGMLYHGERGVRIQGIGSVVQNVSGVIMQLLAGWVCLINVDYVWLVHIIFLAPLIVFLIGCPKDKDMKAYLSANQEKEAAIEHEGTKSQPTGASGAQNKVRMPAKVWIISLMFGLASTCVFGYLLNVASFMEVEGIGSSGMAGVVSAVYTVGGIVAGLLFPTLKKLLKRALVPILFLITGTGMLIGFWGQHGWSLCIASFVIGVSVLMVWPASVVKINTLVAPENMGYANAIFVGTMNFFAFLASFVIKIVLMVMGDNTRNPVLVGAIGLFAIGIWYFYANFKRDF